MKLGVLEKTFAAGVSDARGSVPRFGASVVDVPVTVAVLRMARHALGMLDGKPIDNLGYELNGKLNGPSFSSMRFRSQGEFTLPTATSRRTTP